MSDDRPRFSRKARRRTRNPERDLLIAEIAGRPSGTSSEAPQATTPENSNAETDTGLEPPATASLAAEETLSDHALHPELQDDQPDVDHDILFGTSDRPPAETPVHLEEDTPEADTSDAPHPLMAQPSPPSEGTEDVTAEPPVGSIAKSEEPTGDNATQEPLPPQDATVDRGMDTAPPVAAPLPAVRPTPSQTADAPAPAPQPEIEPVSPVVEEKAPASSSAPEPDPVPDPVPAPAPAPDTPKQAGETWSHLGSIPVDPAHLERNLIITAGRHDPAHGAFDVLRTRLVQTLYDNDWKRVAVTSPTRDCGKTFTAVNLAISLSRYESMRTVLMDMDMRNPSVASVLGATTPGSMGDFLTGTSSVHSHFVRLGRNALNIGNNLAVALNDRIEPYASEMFQDPRTDAAFERMMQELDPDVVLYDLPPALAYDDVIAFKKHFDGILMVVGGGSTTADEVHEAMRRLGDDVPLLGVVLNQAENETRKGYTYGY